MKTTVAQEKKHAAQHGKLKKSERRRQILLELKLQPHVRISALAERFGVSTETVRRDFDLLSKDGLISRAHGGASTPTRGHYPSLDERAHARIAERERIGSRAARLVNEGETVMIDSGSTTIELARALAYLGTPCSVITNSIPVAMTLGQGAAEVILCPGEYLPAESAVVGTETLEFLERFHVDICLIGSSGLSAEGPSETVRGFAAVKRKMISRAARSVLLTDSAKFGRTGVVRVTSLSDLTTIVVDRRPGGDLLKAVEASEVDIIVAD